MLCGLRYTADGSLVDDTGHSWGRVSDWLEPSDAERRVHAGARFVVQECSAPPVAVRPERFKRDVKVHMVTAAVLRDYEGRTTVPTIMVGELRRSSDGADLLLFVEQGPHRRSAYELQDDW